MNFLVTTMISDIDKTLVLQGELNTLTNGDHWKSGFNKKGLAINYPIAIYMELIELIDSAPWKWWKFKADQSVNFDNIKIELVDVYHFLLSEYLIINANQPINVEGIANHFDTSLNIKSNDILSSTELMLEKILAYANTKDTAYFYEFCEIFFYSCSLMFSSNEEFLKLYYSKAVLNKFRQLNGYTEGTYKKDWNGKEDNVVLQEIISEMKGINPDTLYEFLEDAYRTVRYGMDS